MGVSGVGVGRGLRTMGAGGGGGGGGGGLMTKNRRGWGVRWAGDEI